MTPLLRIVREIHRRSLWQVLGIYLVASWIVFEVVQTLTEGLGLPDWLPAFAFVLLLIGLPVVLATAFVQEGVGDASVLGSGGGEVRPPSPGREPGEEGRTHGHGALTSLLTWRNAVFGGVVAFALWGVVAAVWVALGGTAVGGTAVDETANMDSAVTSDRSIAVLPFQNLSGDQEAEAFASGLHDDLLTRLSKVRELDVISWTSVSRYRDTPKSLPEIANELGVAWVLEGGVQRAGERVRVNAQLIDPRTDRHVWADTYNRELNVDNIFEIQSDVVHRIAAALRVEISPQEERLVAAGSPRSLEAYDLYQRGRLSLKGRSPEGIGQAIDYFSLVVERDSSYALAYSGLSDALSLGWFYGYDVGERPLERALSMARRAVDLDPDLAEGHASLGWALTCAQDGLAAEAAFQRALELDPGSPDARHWYGTLLQVLGRPDEALTLLEPSLKLDPLAPAVHASTGVSHMALDDTVAALRQWRRTVDLEPDYALGRLYLARILAFAGDPQGSIRETERARTGFSEKGDSIFGGLASLAAAHALAGQADSARAYLARAEREGNEPLHIGVAYATLGDPDRAFEWLGRSRWERLSPRWLRYHPALDPLRSDSRFAATLADMEEAWGLP